MSDEQPNREIPAMVDLDHGMPAWLEEVWMQRYLDRELSEPETSWFEAYCLDRDHLLTLIEADLALRDGLAANAKALDAKPVSSAAQPRRERPSRMTAAIAASLLVGTLAGVVFGPRVASDSENQITPDVTRLMFDTLRGSEAEARVDHASSDSEFVLLDVAVPSDAREIALKVDGAVQHALTVSRDGFVSALVPRGLVRRGTVSVRYTHADVVVERALKPPQDWESERLSN